MAYELAVRGDLESNPTARVPVCLCLDTSGSMTGSPIQKLTEGVNMFFEAVREDEVAFYAVELCMVTFGENDVRLISDFARLEFQNVPTFLASGMTPMGEAVNMALDLLEKRKAKYQEYGVDYFQPWLVLMTDGKPNGDRGELLRAIARTTELVNMEKLTVFPIGIGDEADMNTLAKFSPKRSPLKLQGLKFCEFFEWLSQSVSRTSQSMPGEKVYLPDVGGWAAV